MKWRSAPGPGPPGSPARCMPPAPVVPAEPPRRPAGSWVRAEGGGPGASCSSRAGLLVRAQCQCRRRYRRRCRRSLLRPPRSGRGGGGAGGARGGRPALAPTPGPHQPPPPRRRPTAPRGAAAAAPRRPARPLAGLAARPASSRPRPRPPRRRPPRRTQSRLPPGSPLPPACQPLGRAAPAPQSFLRRALSSPRSPRPLPGALLASPPLPSPSERSFSRSEKKFGEPPPGGTQGVNGNSSAPPPPKIRLAF